MPRWPLLLVGLTINYFGHYSSLMSAERRPTRRWQRRLTAAQATANDANRLADDAHRADGEVRRKSSTIGDNLQSNVDGRLLWLELLKAIDAALPKDTRPPEQRKETDEDIAKRPELHIESMDCEYFADLTPWQTSITANLRKKAAPPTAAEPGAADPNAVPATDGETPPGDVAAPPATDARAARRHTASTAADASAVPPRHRRNHARGRSSNGRTH